MPRLERLARRASLLAVVSFAGTAFMAPLTGWSANRPAIIPTVGSVAAQLGVKVQSRQADEEFSVGMQFTGLLEDTLKLGSFGVHGFRVGARVTAARISSDRVHIEADELEPPKREFVRVGIDADGRLVRPPKA